MEMHVIAGLGLLADIVAERPRRRRPRSTGIFPFGLRGQTIGLAVLLAEPGAKSLRVHPRDIGHWVILRYFITGLGPVELTFPWRLTSDLNPGSTFARYLRLLFFFGRPP